MLRLKWSQTSNASAIGGRSDEVQRNGVERRVVEAENGLDEVEKRERIERSVETEGGEELEERREKRFGGGGREVEACEMRGDLEDFDGIDGGVLQNALEGE